MGLSIPESRQGHRPESSISRPLSQMSDVESTTRPFV